ncbi:MAG: threonine/serine exporter family protein [Pygmaiobacter massiliensis]|nr:threonine/serine exporter family protein [Pygmaiobacter massiliensis]
MEQHDLLQIATDLASCLLTSGAEIYRVEESVRRIFDAYGAGPYEVFAIPSLLIVSLQRPGAEPLTQVRRLQEQHTHLARVNACNDLCRQICRDRPSYAQAQQKLLQIENIPSYPAYLVTAAYGIVSFGFTLLFGGSVASAIAALPAGAFTELCLRFLARFDTNSFFTTILASFVAGATACCLAALYPCLARDKIIIGTLMTLVPGSALTSSMRDIMAGDLLAGASRLILVLLSACGIALGTGAALSLASIMGGV